MKDHYQMKFIDEEEAKADAKEKSKELGVPLAVLQSKQLYYVDSNTEPMRWEKLIAVYKDGKISK